MTLSRIRLELARDRDFPEGSRHHGYEFVAPIDAAGHIDPDAWKENRQRCRVRHFWGSAEEEVGHVIRKPGGAWAFHYDILGDADDDETGYRFGDHTFRIGDYVTIKEHDDTLRTFRVVAAEDID
ncbi:MAG: hypothetical protein OEL78_08725 [Hyphomicrobiales bacterium]|nr:hypothetical protein [Hyphomicrobiales bacterium]